MRARLQLSQLQARRDLRDAVKAWDADPRKAAQAELNNSSDVRARLEAAAAQARRPNAGPRWLAELDPRLVEQRDWPATAAMLQQAHEQGHDVGHRDPRHWSPRRPWASSPPATCATGSSRASTSPSTPARARLAQHSRPRAARHGSASRDRTARVHAAALHADKQESPHASLEDVPQSTRARASRPTGVTTGSSTAPP